MPQLHSAARQNASLRRRLLIQSATDLEPATFELSQFVEFRGLCLAIRLKYTELTNDDKRT